MLSKISHLRSVLLLTIPVLPFLASCQTSPAAAVEGEYSLSAQSVQINGIIINMADWPGSSVSVAAVDDEAVTVTADSLLLGFDTLTIPATAAGNGDSKYTFSGSYTGRDRDISLTGTVNKGVLSLSITDICTSPVTGRWKAAVADDGLADISLSFYSPLVSDIPYGDGGSIPVEDALVLINAALREAITPELANLGYVELTRTSYVGINWNGDISSEAEPLLQDVIQYWPEPEASRLHIYLRRTITDGMGLEISPLDAALAYSTSEGSLMLSLDRKTISPWLGAISNTVNSTTYEAYLEAGSPFGELSMEEFTRYRSMASLLVASRSMPDTELSLKMRMTPES